MRPKDSGKEDAVTASHVHDAAPSPEIICAGNGRAHQHGELRHGVVENTSQFRMPTQVLPAIHSEDFGSGRPAGFDTVHNLTEGPVKVLGPSENERRPDRSRRSGAEV